MSARRVSRRQPQRGAVNAVDSIYNIDYRKLGSFSVPMAFGIEMNV